MNKHVYSRIAGALVIGSIAAFTLSGAKAGTLSFLSSMGWESIEPDHSYKLDVAGMDTRVYEWTPKAAPKWFCIAQFTNDGPVGMQCGPKE